MIAFFLAPIYLLFHYYILRWLYSWAESCLPVFHSLWFRVPTALSLFFFSMSPLLSMIILKDPFHRALRILANYWLGVLQYIILIVLIFDAVRIITGHPVLLKYKYPAMLHAMPKNLMIFGGIAVTLISAVSLYGVFHAREIKVRQYPVTIQKSSPISGIKIALVADLHLGYNSTEAHIKKMVEEINEQKPDLVCITGDIFDNEYEAIKDPGTVAETLSEIQSTYGVYGCYGNHDISEKILAGFTFPHKGKLERDPRFAKFLSDAGITMLEDETILIDNAFYLGGRRDPSMSKKEQITRLSADELTCSLPRDLPIIVMDHQPKALDASADAGIDLLLSGHTHDGQTFPSTFLVRFLWKNPYGVIHVGNMVSAVTSGSGIWGPAMRIGSDNEIMILNVEFQAP